MVEQIVLNNLVTSIILLFTILTSYYFEDNSAGIVLGIVIGSAINYFFAQQILGLITGVM